MAYKGRSYLEHNAIYVKDVKWHIQFFTDVFGMTVRDIIGPAEEPKQVFFHGGMQLVSDPGFNEKEGREAHLGIMTENLDEVLKEAYSRGVTAMAQGRNWIRLPDGLCIEVMQEKNDAVNQYWSIVPR